jgi:hypothetical protein
MRENLAHGEHHPVLKTEKQIQLPHEFFLAFGGRLNEENSWVKQPFPLDKVEEYHSTLSRFSLSRFAVAGFTNTTSIPFSTSQFAHSDVYLGAPMANPVDPRYRLVTTIYNPTRPGRRKMQCYSLYSYIDGIGSLLGVGSTRNGPRESVERTPQQKGYLE